MADYEQAVAWFTAEHPVLLGAVALAATAGLPTHAWQLVWSLRTYLDLRGYRYESVSTAGTAVAAADRLGDPYARAVTRRLLARGYRCLGQFTERHTQLRQALDLYRQTGDLTGQAHTHQDLSMTWERQDRTHSARDHTIAALDHARRALDLYRAAGHRSGQARALNSVGWCHALLGNYPEAISACQQALSLFHDLGDSDGQAATLDSLGHAHDRLGRYHEAVDCYRRAVDLNRGLGHRYCEAEVLAHLGDTHHTAGNPAAARDAWQHALAILRDLNHPDAVDVRTRLAKLD